MKGWQTKNFSDVLDIKNGRNQKEVESDSGEYPIYGSAGNVMGYANSYICEAGTTIVGRKGNINSPIYSETRFWNVDTAFGLAAKPGLDSKFLYYYCISFDFSALNRGTTIPSLVKSELLGISIPFPPLPEQHRIVAILDAAFDHIATARANCEANLLNVRAIFESHLQAVFTERGDGWEEKNFGDIATFRNGINFTKSSKGDSIRILGVKDFQSHFWAPMDDLDFVIPDGKLPDSDTLLQDDLVFVRSNGNPELIGRCLLVPEASERTTHSGFTIRARLTSSVVLPIYLCHFLKSSVMRREMIDGGNGVNIRSLNQGTLAGLAIPLPSLALQTDIVRQIDALKAETQRLESLYQRKLQALDDLEKSLLHQAFSGLL